MLLVLPVLISWIKYLVLTWQCCLIKPWSRQAKTQFPGALCECLRLETGTQQPRPHSGDLPADWKHSWVSPAKSSRTTQLTLGCHAALAADRVVRLAHYLDCPVCLWHNLNGLGSTIIASGKWTGRLMRTKSYGIVFSQITITIFFELDPSHISYKLILFTISLQPSKCMRWLILSLPQTNKCPHDASTDLT